jgi:hypothetical protein
MYRVETVVDAKACRVEAEQIFSKMKELLTIENLAFWLAGTDSNCIKKLEQYLYCFFLTSSPQQKISENQLKLLWETFGPENGMKERIMDLHSLL